MKHEIIIPRNIFEAVHEYLFSSDVEQGAMLFASPKFGKNIIQLIVEDYYLVPEEGWKYQGSDHLEMKAEERAKILKIARDKNLSLIDCHSHLKSFGNAFFSPSDVGGITDFSAYVKWKLDNKPYGAMVWAEDTMDAVIWKDDFDKAHQVDEIIISSINDGDEYTEPTKTWFNRKIWWISND